MGRHRLYVHEDGLPTPDNATNFIAVDGKEKIIPSAAACYTMVRSCLKLWRRPATTVCPTTDYHVVDVRRGVPKSVSHCFGDEWSCREVVRSARPSGRRAKQQHFRWIGRKRDPFGNA